MKKGMLFLTIIIVTLLNKPVFADAEVDPSLLSTSGGVSLLWGTSVGIFEPLLIPGALIQALEISGQGNARQGATFFSQVTGTPFTFSQSAFGFFQLSAKGVIKRTGLNQAVMPSLGDQTPTATVQIHDTTGKLVEQTIPLMLRKDAMEMNQRIDTTK